MEAQISAATWALLLIPMLGVVVLSALSLFRNPVRVQAPHPEAQVRSPGEGAQ